MEERTAHIVNGFDYLPYGEPNATNLTLYDKFIYTLNLVQQHYWITRFYQGFIDENILNTVNLPLVARQVMSNLTYTADCKPTGLRMCMLTIQQKCDESYSLPIWNHVYYAVFDAHVNNDDMKEVVKWIAKQEGITETYGENVIKAIWQENDLAIIHTLHHGFAAGYYRDYDDLATNYTDNQFVAINPRQAFMDNHIEF